MKKYKATLILGNGFDLSLGLNTSYESFYQYLENTGFISGNEHNNLIDKIKQVAERDNWYDFETIIKQYATSSEDACLLKCLQELESDIANIRYNQEIQKMDVNEIDAVITKIKKSGDNSLQELSDFVHLNKKVDWDNSEKFVDICNRAIQNIHSIQKEYQKNADEIIRKLKDELYEFLRKASKPQIGDTYSPGITLLLAMLGVEYKGEVSALEALGTHCNKETGKRTFNNNVKIVSFNYTDPFIAITSWFLLSYNISRHKMYSNENDPNFPFNIEALNNDVYYPIHGSLRGNDIAFGADNCDSIPVELSVMKKVTQMSDKNAKDKFADILRNSEIIVIFGHSINGIDWEYYQPFLVERPKTPIYIVTYNKDSKDGIERGLSKYNISTNYFFTGDGNVNNDEDFKELINSIIESLRTNLLPNH